MALTFIPVRNDPIIRTWGAMGNDQTSFIISQQTGDDFFLVSCKRHPGGDLIFLDGEFDSLFEARLVCEAVNGIRAS